jgi:RNA polymerase sigma factor (sigma-70 family)
LPADLPVKEEGPCQIAEANEDIQRQREALESLSPGQRGAVLLYYEGKTHQEVSSIVGVPRTTVYAMTQTGLRMLRRAMGGDRE